MTIYEKHNDAGIAWFRGSDGKKLAGNVSLSAFGEKYSTIEPTIRAAISGNNITHLDVIQDVLILKTSSVFFIDKFGIVDNLPVPISHYDNSIFLESSYDVDYWFDENKKCIYTISGGISAFPDYRNHFVYDIHIFDIIKNLYTKAATLYFNLSCPTIESLEPIRLCYNPDTKTFNLSTIFYISNVSDMNLFSINIKNSDKFVLDTFNVVFPKKSYSVGSVTIS